MTQSVVEEKCQQGSLGRHRTVEERQKKQWSRLGGGKQEEAKEGSRRNSREDTEKKGAFTEVLQNKECILMFSLLQITPILDNYIIVPPKLLPAKKTKKKKLPTDTFVGSVQKTLVQL